MNHVALLLTLLSLLPGMPATTLADCRPQRIDLKAGIGRVLDGDTLQLDNHRRIRLIGINAPEFAHHGQAAQPFAEQAHMALTALLDKYGGQLLLQYGQDRYDRYGRTLAHAFLPDGTSLAEQLLASGLAVRIAFPPNLWAQDCYAGAERIAREQRLGLWRNIIVNADKLTADSKGFHIIEGTVERIGYSRKSVWLNFQGHFAARIARKELDRFSNIDLKNLAGRRLQVRGWVYGNKDKRIMRLRHSSMIDIMK